MHIDTGPSRMTAILGSCVGVALWDPSTKIGALAHVMLPRNPGGDDKKAKYADTVLPPLMDSMKTMGAASGGFNAKLAGGASVIFAEGIHPAMQVGERNIEVIRQELKALQIPVVGEDVGGTIGRKMLVDLDTFRVRVKMLSRQGGR
ncbi:chemotaxis protein CheD [Myxococcota bacterium]|nr:chemotaxis protein CheD [Myxococcota bacterium]